MKLADRRKRILLRELLFRAPPGSRRWRSPMLERLAMAPGIHAGARIVLHTSHLRPERSELRVGSNVEIGDEVLLDVTGVLTIKDDVTISERAVIYTHNHRVADRSVHWREQGVEAFDVTVGRGAWIGSSAIVLGSAGQIGEGAIVAAGAVVTKPVAPFTVVAGNPARKISERS